MNFDFSLLLVIATFVTGVIWGIDALFFAKQRLADAEKHEGDEKEKELKEPILVEYSRFLFPVVLIVLVLRSFIAEPFRIPTGSMIPTLHVGDFILVNKFAYGIRLPVMHNKVIDLGQPERGDVIVFRYPENPSIDYIKRVVGVPGDKIAYYNKVLYINDKPAKLEFKEHTSETQKVYRENMAGIEHDIMIDMSRFDSDFQITIPKNKYFVLGDNRDNSRDSRYWGFVPDENLVGKAFFVWMSWPSMSRIGTVIE